MALVQYWPIDSPFFLHSFVVCFFSLSFRSFIGQILITFSWFHASQTRVSWSQTIFRWSAFINECRTKNATAPINNNGIWNGHCEKQTPIHDHQMDFVYLLFSHLKRLCSFIPFSRRSFFFFFFSSVPEKYIFDRSIRI